MGPLEIIDKYGADALRFHHGALAGKTTPAGCGLAPLESRARATSPPSSGTPRLAERTARRCRRFGTASAKPHGSTSECWANWPRQHRDDKAMPSSRLTRRPARLYEFIWGIVGLVRRALEATLQGEGGIKIKGQQERDSRRHRLRDR